MTDKKLVLICNFSFTGAVVGLISASFVFDAPALVGGANPKKRAELHVSGLLGMMRFWWRMRRATDFDGRANDFRELEFALFGAAAKEKTNRGQGAFTAWLEQAPKPGNCKLQGQDPRKQLFKFGNGYASNSRGYLPCCTSFTLNLLINPLAPLPENVSTEDVERQLIDTLKLMGLLGGVGYGWRRGFGSLRLTEFTLDEKHIDLGGNNEQTCLQNLRDLLAPFQNKGMLTTANNMFAHLSMETVIFYKTYVRTMPENAHKQFADAAAKEAQRNGMTAGEFFSDQTNPHDRRPSPVGIHVRKLVTDTLITATRLRPSWIGGYPDRIDSFLDDDGFQILGVQPAHA